MPPLDFYTILVTIMMISIVCSSVALMSIFRSRHLYRGMISWALLFLFQGLGIFLILLRGRVPDIFSILLAQAFLIGGIWMGEIGIMRFLGVPPRIKREALIFTAFLLFTAYWTYVETNISFRSQAHAVTMILFLGFSAGALLFPKDPEMRAVTRTTGIIYAFLVLVFCFRFLVQLLDPYLNNSYLDTHGWEPVFFLIFGCSYVMVATSMVVMVNRRLRLDFRKQKEGELLRQEKEHAVRQKILEEKNQALSELKVLSGMLPICGSCKKIRDDQGYWNQIESYIHAHSQAKFSHGICPDCAKKLYPEVWGHDSEELSGIKQDEGRKKSG